jgi:hypothetical protein
MSAFQQESFNSISGHIILESPCHRSQFGPIAFLSSSVASFSSVISSGLSTRSTAFAFLMTYSAFVAPIVTHLTPGTCRGQAIAKSTRGMLCFSEILFKFLIVLNKSSSYPDSPCLHFAFVAELKWRVLALNSGTSFFDNHFPVSRP